ncbi:MAG: PhnD/SsuA/transferrin family substrate-binding protein [Deltaproteobacteria bacterium]|nr:PhnD/SsuA/transferrin family substrate-binding protein [Deltaproteobacteria bacterium]
MRTELAHRLGQALGSEWEVVSESSYQSLLERVVRRKAALAWLPPATFVRAFDQGAIAKVFSAERMHAPRYRGALFVRRASQLDGLEALKGKRVAWVDPDSCAGHLFPKLELLEKGLEPDALFLSQAFLGAHMRVVRAVRDGEVDVGATFVQLAKEIDGAVETKAKAVDLLLVGWSPFVPRDEMHPILITRPIPADALCTVCGLPQELEEKLSALLLNLSSSPRLLHLFRSLLNADRFVSCQPAHYDDVRRAIARIGKGDQGG